MQYQDFSQIKVRLGVSDGTTNGWQLLRNYGGYFVEPVRDVVDGTLALYADGVSFSHTLGADGWVTPIVAQPADAVITASFEYYWRVAFNDSELTWENFWYNYYSLKEISLISVR